MHSITLDSELSDRGGSFGGLHPCFTETTAQKSCLNVSDVADCPAFLLWTLSAPLQQDVI